LWTCYDQGGMTRHLKACGQRKKAITTADDLSGKEETIFHLKVQDAWGGDYWPHLEMRGGTELYDLDQYLRAIWLECCGHMSAFSSGSHQYTQIVDHVFTMGDERSMDVLVETIFEPGQKIPYEYDFGTTSELVIKVVGVRQGKPLTLNPLFLMARNHALHYQCQECEKTAAWLCEECIYEEDKPGLLCEEHAETHPHEDYGGPAPLVNSPRSGLCAYYGPAEPPY